MPLQKGLLKEYARIFSLFLRLVDLVVILGASWFAFYLSNAHEFFEAQGITGLPVIYQYVVILVVVLSVLVFPLFTVYGVWRGASVFAEIKQITVAWTSIALMLAGIAFVTQTGLEYSRSWMVAWYLLGGAGLVSSRIVLRTLLYWLRLSGFNKRYIIIIGTGGQAMRVAQRLQKSTWFGLEIVAFFGSKPDKLPEDLSGIEVIEEMSKISAYVSENTVDQVWIAMSHKDEGMVRDVISNLNESAVSIRYVPDIFEFQVMHHSLTEIAGMPVMNLSYTPIEGSNKYLKALEDYVMASIFIILLSPLMLIIAALISVTSNGPVLYRQQRMSWDGAPFEMLKFRTMPENIESDSGAVWAKKGESRASGFGQLLRSTSLDELPQLFNVLKGEMSLVGPRPERPVFVEKFKNEIPKYMEKHLVKAGMTGWAQVNGWRGNTDLNSRIEHDLYYIDNWSVWLDIKIILMTLFKGFVNKNAY